MVPFASAYLDRSAFGAGSCGAGAGSGTATETAGHCSSSSVAKSTLRIAAPGRSSLPCGRIYRGPCECLWIVGLARLRRQQPLGVPGHVVIGHEAVFHLDQHIAFRADQQGGEWMIASRLRAPRHVERAAQQRDVIRLGRPGVCRHVLTIIEKIGLPIFRPAGPIIPLLVLPFTCWWQPVQLTRPKSIQQARCSRWRRAGPPKEWQQRWCC